jgi:hypothetical protein
MKELELTTGQLSGVTLLSYGSIYRYVKDFPDFFSDRARQHTRGRRWTIKDLEAVQAIRYLYHDNTPREQIYQMLSEGWRPLMADTTETITKLVEATLTEAAEARKFIKSEQKALEDFRLYNRTLWETSEEVRRLKERVTKLEEDLRSKGKKKPDIF